MFDGTLCTMVYGAWWLRQETWGTVKTHAEEVMNIPVLRDPVEDVYVKILSMFVREIDARHCPEE